jgi:NADH-quinone oxidoreductase subunit J
MTAVQIIFILVAAMTLGAGMLVVTAKNLIHSALWLVLSLFGVAILYVLLDAGFLAVVQVMVYIGAIAILIIFGIMLTRKIAPDSGPRFTENWGWALVIAVLAFGGLIWLLSNWNGVQAAPPPISERFDSLRQLGVALVSPDAYVLAFELASVLLLAALIGALVIAWERK